MTRILASCFVDVTSGLMLGGRRGLLSLAMMADTILEMWTMAAQEEDEEVKDEERRGCRETMRES